jgi:diaminobutyrate-2-oxoglutarate transaminase
MKKRLTEIAEVVPGAKLKGRGLMRGVDVGSGDLAGEICAKCFENGLIIETSGADDEVVKVLAALTTPADVLNKGFDILFAAVREIVPAEQPMAAE